MTLYLAAENRAIAQNHAEATYPEECCGLLLGKVDASFVKVVSEVRPMWNTWNEEIERYFQAIAPTHTNPTQTRISSKADRFSIDPQEMLRVQKESRDRGLEIVGIYHSHPDGQAIPSAFDRAIAWEQYSYAIVAVAAGRATDLRSWMLDREGSFQMEAIDFANPENLFIANNL